MSFNTPEGVTLEAEGSPAAIDGLIAALKAPPPPAAVVTLTRRGLAADRRESALPSATVRSPATRSAAVLPDLATCEACLAEVLDPADRRYRYPFTNCTHCGPRYSIITDLPYDRSRTTMRRFVMCPECRAEYENPADRRFHAEPNACPVCGPQLALWDGQGAVLAARDDALAAARPPSGGGQDRRGQGPRRLPPDGRCAQRGRGRAGSAQRKHREEKPFAVMFASLRCAREAADADRRRDRAS